MDDDRYDHLLPEIQDAILERGLSIPRPGDASGLRAFRGVLAEMLVRRLPPDANVMAVADRLARMMMGLGVLQPLVDDPDVDEVMVRPGGHVFVDRRGGVEYVGQMAPDRYFRQLAAYVADMAGRPLSPRRPAVITDLPGGQRFTALVPPLSPEGTAINIRVYRVRRYSLEELAALGAFSDPTEAPPQDLSEEVPEAELPEGLRWARRLRELARRAAASILISGAFSTGKTTLLNALMAFLPETTMVAVAETFRELELPHRGAVRAVVQPTVAGEEGIRLGEAINTLLTRARPDVVVLGEITAHEEAVEFLRAANLGVRAWATIHGNSAAEALVRLADLAVRAGVPLEAVRSQVAAAVDLVVHMARHRRRRYVAEIARVEGVAPDGFRLRSLYRAGPGREELLERTLRGEAAAVDA